MNERLVKSFRTKLAGKGVLGPFMKSGDPAFVEAAGYAGMDFAVLDMEHGPVSLEGMQNNIRAAQVAGMLPILRVSALHPALIAQALDIGAAGVQVPQVTSAGEARAAVCAAKYHPLGERGVCRYVRAAHYSALSGERYFSGSNENTLVIIMLEGQQALQNLEEILRVDGVDVLFVGPYDLSQSLGVLGRITHPKVVGQMRDIVQRARAAGVVTGTFTDSAETLAMWRDAGVGFLSYSVDVGIFHDACSQLARAFHRDGLEGL